MEHVAGLPLLPLADCRPHHVLKDLRRGLRTRTIGVGERVVAVQHICLEHLAHRAGPLAQRDGNLLGLDQFTACLAQQGAQVVQNLHLEAQGLADLGHPGEW